MEIHGIQVEFDITNPETYEKYEKLITGFQAAATSENDFLALLKSTHEIVKAGIADLFGKETAARLCGETVSARKAMDVYCALLRDYKKQLDEFMQLKDEISCMFSAEA